MSEITKHLSESIEYVDDDEELAEFLEAAAMYIGMIVIELNSLEDAISFQITELMSSSTLADEKVSVFLADMSYARKVEALIKLFGQENVGRSLNLGDELSELLKNLKEAGSARNQYAHADWSDVGEDGFIRVKTRANIDGVFHTYRKFDEATMERDLEFITDTHGELLALSDRFTI